MIIRILGIGILLGLLSIAAIYGTKRLAAYSGKSNEAAEDFGKTKVSMSMLASELSRVLKQRPTNLLDFATKVQADPYAPPCLINSTNPFPSVLPAGDYKWIFPAESPEYPIDSPLIWRKFSIWGGTVVFITFAGEVESMPSTNWTQYLRERQLTVNQESNPR